MKILKYCWGVALLVPVILDIILWSRNDVLGKNSKWFSCPVLKVYMRRGIKYLGDMCTKQSTLVVSSLQVEDSFRYLNLGTTFLSLLLIWNVLDAFYVENAINGKVEGWCKTNGLCADNSAPYCWFIITRKN